MTKIEDIERKLKELEKRVGKLEGYSSKPQQIKLTKHSITDLLLELKSEGFFKQPRTTNEIIKILAMKGRHYSSSSLSWPLQHAIRTRILGRIKKDKVWMYVAR